MMKATLKWHGEEARLKVIATGWQYLVRAVVEYHTLLLKTLAVPNPRPYLTPSRPGEPPRKRTGAGQSGVQYELDEATHSARVGVLKNVVYMLYLELGTRRVAARPWLLATLKRNLAKLSDIAAGR